MRKVSLSSIIEDPISGEWGEDGEGVAVLRSTNFTNEGRLNLDNVVQRAINKKKIEKKKLLFGDSIIEKSGGSPDQPVGRVVYFDIQKGTFLCSNFTSILRPSNEIHPRYFFWFLFYNHQIKRTLKYQNKTTGIINLQLARYLEETKIPLPQFPIQQKVAAILDKANSLSQKDKQLLILYDDLAQSVFYKMFGDPVRNNKGWKKKPLAEMIDFPGSLVDPRESPYSEMIHVGGDNIESSTGKLINLRKANDLGLRSGKFLFDSSHILYNKIRPYLNKVAKPDFSGLCSADMYPLKPKNGINRDFLFWILRSEDFQNFASAQSRRANIPKINREEISAYSTILPDIQTQERFSFFISEYEKSKDKLNRAITRSDDLFQSVLQQAFNGELVKG